MVRSSMQSISWITLITGVALLGCVRLLPRNGHFVIPGPMKPNSSQFYLSGKKNISFEDYASGSVTSKDTGDSRGINILDVEPPKFLPQFKNPCWMEPSGPCTSRTHESIRCLPYFYIIGQPKCGTTDLFRHLTQHPQVARAIRKEPHWWTRRRFNNHQDGSKTFSQYVDIFQPLAGGLGKSWRKNWIIGEASASTLWDNTYWQRFPENSLLPEPRVLIAHHIHHFQPEAKLIVTFRDPVTRTYSDYLFFTKTNKTVDNFHDRMMKSIDKWKECRKKSSEMKCVLAAEDNRIYGPIRRLVIGLYVIHLEQWLQVFRRDQVLVLRFEDYARNRTGPLNQLTSFLNIDPWPSNQLRRFEADEAQNSRRPEDKKMPQMRSDTEQLLREFFRPFNHRLSRLLKDDRFIWH